MKAMVSVGEAHNSSIVAAYEVGTLTSKFNPVASFKACAITSPPVVMILASTDGTKSTLIGCSGEPIFDVAGSVAGDSVAGASVAGASVGRAWVGTGGSVGARVAGAQAETTSTTIVIMAKSKLTDFFIFLLLLRYLELGKVPNQIR